MPMLNITVKAEIGDSVSEPLMAKNASPDEGVKSKLEAVPPLRESVPSSEVSNSKKVERWQFYFKLIVGIIFGIVVYTLCKSAIYNFLNFETTDDAQISAHAMVLNAKVGGIVARVFFNDNADVKRGDVLFSLDTREYLFAINQINAELNAMNAKYWYQAAEYKRARYLFERKVISQTILDSHKSQYNEALALVWAKRAQLDQAKLNLEFTEIKAPANGMLGKIQIEPGFVIRPQQILTSFLDDRERWIVANFKETQLQNIRVGQQAEVEIDAIENKIFYGTVESIAPGSGSSFSLIPADNATGNFTKIVQRVAVKIALSSESTRGFERRIVPGISAFVKVRVRPDKSPL